MAVAPPDPVRHDENRILLVEDNFLVAQMLAAILSERGCEVVGPVANLEQGLELAKSEALAGAILDINIIGGTSVPIAEALEQRHTPFFFISGYRSPGLLPRKLDHVYRLTKPIDEPSLESAMHNLFAIE